MEQQQSWYQSKKWRKSSHIGPLKHTSGDNTRIRARKQVLRAAAIQWQTSDGPCIRCREKSSRQAGLPCETWGSCVAGLLRASDLRYGYEWQLCERLWVASVTRVIDSVARKVLVMSDNRIIMNWISVTTLQAVRVAGLDVPGILL